MSTVIPAFAGMTINSEEQNHLPPFGRRSLGIIPPEDFFNNPGRGKMKANERASSDAGFTRSGPRRRGARNRSCSRIGRNETPRPVCD